MYLASFTHGHADKGILRIASRRLAACEHLQCLHSSSLRLSAEIFLVLRQDHIPLPWFLSLLVVHRLDCHIVAGEIGQHLSDISEILTYCVPVHTLLIYTLVRNVALVLGKVA